VAENPDRGMAMADIRMKMMGTAFEIRRCWIFSFVV
jgi:hypothetical protein